MERTFNLILRAVPGEGCQADVDEVLVPNEIMGRDQDNNFFVGLKSRKPARFGRVVPSRTAFQLDDLASDDYFHVFGTEVGEGQLDPDRVDSLRFFVEAIAEYETGAVLGCSVTFETDEDGEEELIWEIFDVEEES